MALSLQRPMDRNALTGDGHRQHLSRRGDAGSTSSTPGGTPLSVTVPTQHGGRQPRAPARRSGLTWAAEEGFLLPGGASNTRATKTSKRGVRPWTTHFAERLPREILFDKVAQGELTRRRFAQLAAMMLGGAPVLLRAGGAVGSGQGAGVGQLGRRRDHGL